MKKIHKIINVLVLFLMLGNLTTSSIVNADIYNVAPQIEEEDDCYSPDSDSKKRQESTVNSTNSSVASDTDWTKEGTTAYNNAKKVFMAFVNNGTSGSFAAGVVGWVNSEGGFSMIGRAEGHYGNNIKENSIAYGVVPTGLSYYTTEPGGGIFQFTPYTKYAPLGSPDWENADKMIDFVIKEVARGDWNPSHDLTGGNHSFQEAAQMTNPQEATLTWNAYERGNTAYIHQDQKKSDAQKAYEIFGGSKYKYDKSKLEKAFGSGSVTENPEQEKKSTKKSSKKSSKKNNKSKELPNVSPNDWELVLVNRDNKKEEMNPSLATVENIQVDSRIEEATKKLLEEAKKIDSSFHLISGYRSVDTQKGVYESYIQKEMGAGISREEAEKKVQTYSQPPGASEHQTGLAIDISTIDSLNEMPKDKAEKLKEAALKLGFVRRFEDNKSSSTGVGFEDWHFRYVGVESAKYMTEKNLSLEEYISQLKNGDNEQDSEDDCDDKDSKSSSSSHGGTGEWSKDKTGKVNYQDHNAWKPQDLPNDLKPYAINPESIGMKYGSKETWTHKVWNYGQCTDLSTNLMYGIWEKNGDHPVQTMGNGNQVVSNWVSIFKGKESKTPTAGAVFSSYENGDAGHTGVVSHVFENGDILICEQNYLGLSGDAISTPATWNYRYISTKYMSSQGYSFYSPAEAGYKIVSEAKSH